MAGEGMIGFWVDKGAGRKKRSEGWETRVGKESAAKAQRRQVGKSSTGQEMGFLSSAYNISIP